MFRTTNFRALDTLTIFSNISKIRILIQIKPCKNRQYTNGSIKEEPFLNRGSNKLYFSQQEKKVGRTSRQYIVTKSSIIDNHSLGVVTFKCLPRRGEVYCMDSLLKRRGGGTSTFPI